MRKMISFFLIGLSLLVGTTAFADTATSQCIDGKFYVSPGTVHVAPNGIFLNLEGSFLPVEAVYTDDLGVYCLLPNCSSKIHDWRCPREGCGIWNGAWRMYCQACKHPRPESAIDG